MDKVYSSIQFVCFFFSKAAARKKKEKKPTTVVSHIAENLLHIVEKEINKHFPGIDGLFSQRIENGTVVVSSGWQLQNKFALK